MLANKYYLTWKHYKTPKFGAKIYNILRLSIFPLDWFSSITKELKGEVLCLGCGYGILETLLAIMNPKIRFIASDFDVERIEIAKKATRDIKNIKFEVADATAFRGKKQYQSILMIDLLHHLPFGEQEILLDKLWRSLKPNGIVVIKDVDTKPAFGYHWNMLHDRLMAGLPLVYHPSSHYIDYLKSKVAQVAINRPKLFLSPYNHYCLIAKKSRV